MNDSVSQVVAFLIGAKEKFCLKNSNIIAESFPGLAKVVHK